MVFDTDLDCFHYYSTGTTEWVNLCTVNGGGGGADGADGIDGIDGDDGIHCWDTNGNGIDDPAEDTNGDTFFNTEDCQGADGATGPQGPAGADGTDGAVGPQGPAGSAGSITDVDVNATGTISVVTDDPATYTSTESVWTTLGNSGTNVTNNFIGTTDAVDFAVRTNNTEQMIVTSGGQIIINNTTANATDKLASYRQNGVAIGGYALSNTAANSVGVYGVSTGAGVDNYGVYGFADGATGNATSVFGLSDGNATGIGGVITAGTTYPGVWGFASPALATGII